MSGGRTISEILGLGHLRNRMEAVRQLRDESGATIIEARDALVETGYDMEEARQLLKARGQWETLETRKAKIAKRIDDLEEHKRDLHVWFQQSVADVDRQIAQLNEDLGNLG